jgi:ABC-type multidrug transport system permease subunit
MQLQSGCSRCTGDLRKLGAHAMHASVHLQTSTFGLACAPAAVNSSAFAAVLLAVLLSVFGAAVTVGVTYWQIKSRAT